MSRMSARPVHRLLPALLALVLVGCSASGDASGGDGTAAASDDTTGPAATSGTTAIAGTTSAADADATAAAATSATSSSDTSSADPSSGDGTTTAALDTSTGAETPAWPQACADIYAPDLLPTFELTISDADWQAFADDCAQYAKNYHPVEFTYDGETVSAMARLKGNWSYDCSKYQFVVSFNEADPDGRFHGLRKIVLDAPWYDHTLLHERIAFPLFEALALPSSCANNARLVVNGEYYGLYANVERIDKEYLQRNFEAADGNLYEGGWELKTNEDVNDTTRRDALWAATTVDEVAALMDLDEAVAEWAAEAMLPAMDGYWAGVEINYYLYDHPDRGFLFLPYDLDLAFGDAAYPGGPLVWPDAAASDPITYEHPGWLKEPLVQMVLADDVWCDRFVDALGEARAAYSVDAMVAAVAEADDQIRDALVDDPRRPYSMTEHDLAVDGLQAFFAARAAVVDDWLAAGDHCPASW